MAERPPLHSLATTAPRAGQHSPTPQRMRLPPCDPRCKEASAAPLHLQDMGQQSTSGGARPAAFPSRVHLVRPRRDRRPLRTALAAGQRRLGTGLAGSRSGVGLAGSSKRFAPFPAPHAARTHPSGAGHAGGPSTGRTLACAANAARARRRRVLAHPRSPPVPPAAHAPTVEAAGRPARHTGGKDVPHAAWPCSRPTPCAGRQLNCKCSPAARPHRRQTTCGFCGTSCVLSPPGWQDPSSPSPNGTVCQGHATIQWCGCCLTGPTEIRPWQRSCCAGSSQHSSTPSCNAWMTRAATTCVSGLPTCSVQAPKLATSPNALHKHGSRPGPPRPCSDSEIMTASHPCGAFEQIESCSRSSWLA